MLMKIKFSFTLEIIKEDLWNIARSQVRMVLRPKELLMKKMDKNKTFRLLKPKMKKNGCSSMNNKTIFSGIPS